MVHSVCRPSERIFSQDAFWGLVLLGLLIAQVFGQPDIPTRGHSSPLDHHTELPVHFIVQMLASGQFERMGSFLFGLGMYRCWGKIRQDNPSQDGQRNVRRLLLGLLAIGLGLSLLLNRPDLLLQYALLGFTLPYFISQSVSSLVGWIVGLLLLATLVPSSLGLLHPKRVTHPPDIGWYTLSEWLQTGRSVSQGFTATISYELMILGGLLVGKLGLMSPNSQLRVRLSLLLISVLPLSFLLKGAWVALSLGLVILPERLLGYQSVLLAFSGFWGALLLTVVYLLELGLNSQWRLWGWANWLGQVGQLSVTNYVIQTILYPLLLNGYGLAVSGSSPLWERAAIIGGIYTLQLGFSWLWMKRYRQGPLELVLQQWLRR